MDNNSIDYRQLYEEGKRFLKLELNYSKLTAVEKLAVLLSTMAFVAVVAILGAFVLFYLASTLVMTTPSRASSRPNCTARTPPGACSGIS